MKEFIALFALALLVLPVLGAVRRLRRLPPPDRGPDRKG
jgi:hypothetical protein